MNYLIFMLVALALAVAGCSDPQTRDAEDIQGIWLPVTAVLGGDPIEGGDLTNSVMKLLGGKWEISVDGSVEKGDYHLDGLSTPKTLDLTVKEGGPTSPGEKNGPSPDRKMPCIYELNRNILTICIGDTARPTDFKSQPGTQFILVTLQRKK